MHFYHDLLMCNCCIVVSPCSRVTFQNEGSCRVNNGIASCFCKGDYTGSNYMLDQCISEINPFL